MLNELVRFISPCWKYWRIDPRFLFIEEGSYFCNQVDRQHVHHTFHGIKSLHFQLLLVSRYRFTIVDIIGRDRESDTELFSLSVMSSPEQLNFPEPDVIHGLGKTPYVFIGDKMFPLRPNLMRPYPNVNLDHSQRLFNYRWRDQIISNN